MTASRRPRSAPRCEACAPVLEEYPDARRSPTCSPAAAEATVLPQALAAIDLALWDLAGRRTREPVWRLLGAGPPAPVAVNWTIAVRRPLGRGPRGGHRPGRGLRHRQGQGGDRRRRRPAGRGARLRRPRPGDPHRRQRRLVSATRRRRRCRRWRHVGSSCARSPFAAWRRSARCWATGQLDYALALDESAADPDALVRPAADAHLPEDRPLRRDRGDHRHRRAAPAPSGYDVYLASTLDGPLGIAAALHAAP